MREDANKIPTGTAQGLLEFLDFLIEKGYGTGAAVSPWKSAANQIFTVVEQGKDLSSIDVRSLDVSEYVNRFSTLAIGKIKQESVAAYGKRFDKAVTAYREYLDHQRLPSIRRVSTTRSTPAAPSTKPTNGNGNGNGADVPSLIDYPFPLRSGQVAHLRLPIRLEKADAERLGAFVRTLAFEPQLELTESTTGEAS